MGGIIGGVASVAGGLFASKSADKSADAQVGAAREANELQRDIYENNVELAEPFRQSGLNNLQALNFELGLGDRPTFNNEDLSDRYTIDEVKGTPAQGGRVVFSGGRNDRAYRTIEGATAATPDYYKVDDRQFDSRGLAQDYIDEQIAANTTQTEYKGFQETPSYKFQLEQGNKALERSAAARGQTQGGAFAQDSARFAQGLASQEYNTFLNRLAAGAGQGQTQTNSLAALGQSFANNSGNNLRAAGNAQASGYANQSNIFNQSLNNLSSIYGASQQQRGNGIFG